MLNDRESGWLLGRTFQAVRTATSARLEEEGLTLRDLVVLREAAAAPRHQRDLARAAGLDKTTMVATVDSLERRGYVRRSPDPRDRRAHLVEVSEEGLGAATRGAERVREIEGELLGDLGAGEQELLRDLLERLLAGRLGAAASGSCV